ncbi:MAG: hypothetical protein ACSHX4_13145 [Opitutaceae bacterium]
MKYPVIAALLLSTTSFAHADLIVYELGSTASKTLSGLGTSFVVGCSVVAVGLVVAAFLAKKK